MSKRQQRITELEDKYEKAVRLGAEEAIDSLAAKIEQYEEMTDEEYETFERVKKMYGSASVKPII